MKIKSFHPSSDLYEVALQYVGAMERRREATDADFLAQTWAKNESLHVEHEGSYLMLRRIGGQYVASHFAPRTMRGGVELLKLVLQRGDVFFTVTEDLCGMLERVGFVRLPAFLQARAANSGLPEGKVVLIPRKLSLREIARLTTGGLSNFSDHERDHEINADLVPVVELPAWEECDIWDRFPSFAPMRHA